ncbi:GH36-type glycosyl hydrolase domain-containing protein [Paenibacillus sp. B01]|uniref:GH36-type glycosyl hydrolase domain-containing protein n=1 Tax=Paenibacillus sp. B01 TaxID=2660554 RepID=UPI00129A9D3E|nr:cellobiose phosphorylase [Paenibacillus sp. B01]QGG57040.1 cellobiose phosphorylase [Paenibacillus sp. B01]
MMTILPSGTELQAGRLRFAFLNSGDLQEASCGNILINQLPGNPIDGSLSNIYLRLHRESGIEAVPLLGIRSSSRLSRSGQSLTWEGSALGISYRVDFHLTEEDIWFWDVRLTGSGVEADLIYGQDMGLADKGAVRSNEAYMSQYMDHQAFRDEQKGYVLCSRQNQPQQGSFPYMQQGALTGADGYSTDGFQFFGLSYKETNVPERLAEERLANRVYQYEFAYAALQSRRIRLNGEARIVFYGLFKENHPSAVSSLEYGEAVAKAWAGLEKRPPAQGQAIPKAALKAAIGSPLSSPDMDLDEIRLRFPERSHEEWDGETLLSFFTPEHEHIVLKSKELRVERPHGHILMAGHHLQMDGEMLTTTAYMYGVFNSQVVVGNTSFNKMLSNTRNALNVMKTSGQRIYVELDGKYRLLAMPSAFEMGFNYAKWYYKLPGDTLVVASYTPVDEPEVRLRVVSETGKAYRYLVTNQATMNNNEYETPFHMSRDGDGLIFEADGRSLCASAYPKLRYRLRVTGTDFRAGDECLLADQVETRSASLAVLELGASASWELAIQGLLHGKERPAVPRDMESEIAKYRSYLNAFLNGFQLSLPGGSDSELGRINVLARWYTHNMLVHFSVPHGLEQYGGAAWGTRDVCQGPVEYFLATQRHETVRRILLEVFSHQYEDTGNWPQWFMFDRYYKIQGEESHGDIIVWPLKALGDYLNATKDYGILEELVPYMDRHAFEFTDEKAPILAHLLKEIGYIKEHFLHGTHLSAYGDGDWDDTLQPANAQLKQFMVSSWTVALTYQAFARLSAALMERDAALAAELRELADSIQADFQRYMLPTGVIPGFLYMEEPGQPELMLHPEDAKTGIRYRLLPMTRSMIAELLTEEQAEAHYALIKEKLQDPDGVRLMDRPAAYAGGVSTRFKRAEQAANFGREVGLQYVHAHIRFVEAMAKLGHADEAWQGLHRINPVGLRDYVANADLRQSNAYFSSSDGKFNDRYEAQERFEELKQGKALVKGGWRIYSSGPGIYMNQLISHCLGIRMEGGDLVIDPVLPDHLDGLHFGYRVYDLPVEFVYHLASGQSGQILVNGTALSGREQANRYRRGGSRLSRELLLPLLKSEGNRIDIYA